MMPTMLLKLNGQETTTADNCTVEALLRDQGLQNRPCAVELNREVVPRQAHAKTTLHEGDEVELVTLVGGG